MNEYDMNCIIERGYENGIIHMNGNEHNMIYRIDRNDKWIWQYSYDLYGWLYSVDVMCEHVW